MPDEEARSDKQRVTLSTYLPCKLDELAAELERDSAGMESQSRTITAFCGALHKKGILEKKYVIPRSRLESLVKRDGMKRIQNLADRRPKGLLCFTFVYKWAFSQSHSDSYLDSDVEFIKCT